MREGLEPMLMEPAPCLLLLLLGGYCLAVTDGEGELRCYCNESGCVSTGYMCKSPVGQCYTAVEVQDERTRATHGCLDSIPPEHRGMCGQQAGGQQPSSEERQNARGNGVEEGGQGRRRHEVRPRDRSEAVGIGNGGSDGGRVVGEGRTVSRYALLICCAEDMCNYIENIDFSSITSLTRTNGSVHRGGTGDRDVIYGERRNAEERDLWFKAAVIAVPIAGGFILVLLVLLAVRMLRTDTQQHRRLIQVRRERSMTKAQVYVTDHFSDVSTTSRGDMTSGSCGGNTRCGTIFQPKHTAASGRHENCPGSRGGGGRPVLGGGGGERGGLGGASRGSGERGRGGEHGDREIRAVPGKNIVMPASSTRGVHGKAVCRDVSVSVGRESRVCENLQCDVSVHRHGHQHHNFVPSVVTWGCPSDLASVV